MAFQKECPVDLVAVNGNRIRVSAFFVFALAVAYLLSNSPFIPAFLVVDFYLRAFYNGRYSLLQWMALQVEKSGWIGVKLTDRAPKRFAAQIGFLLTDMLLIFAIIGLDSVAFYLAALLGLFSFLESFLGFCAGCYLFTFYNRFKQQFK